MVFSSNVNIQRKILQFGDFVFPQEPRSQNWGSPIKASDIEIPNQHGIFNCRPVLIDGHDIEMIITFDPDAFPDKLELRLFLTFMQQELLGGAQGNATRRMYAVDYDGTIIYTWAQFRGQEIEVSNTDTKFKDIALSFKNISGVWYRADTYNTFVAPCYCESCQPWQDLNFMGCVTDPSNCNKTECNGCSGCTSCLCECKAQGCDGACNAIPICEAYKQDVNFFDKCSTPMRIIHSCSEGERLFGDVAVLGEGIAIDVTHPSFDYYLCNPGVLPTRDVQLTFLGDWINPRVEMNDGNNFVEVPGVFTDGLTIDSANNKIIKKIFTINPVDITADVPIGNFTIPMINIKIRKQTKATFSGYQPGATVRVKFLEYYM